MNNNDNDSHTIISEPHNLFPTVTLVGSTKFPELFLKYAREFTLRGYLVHTVHLFGHQEGMNMRGDTKKLLDKMYLQKIYVSDEIFVINPNGYIGLGACDEIHFAAAHNKNITFMEPVEHWDTIMHELRELT